MEPDIFSENDLKETIETRKDSVVAILCDESSDLYQIESKLKSLQIPLTLYDPYKDDYTVIKKFLGQVRSQRKGLTQPYSSYLKKYTTSLQAPNPLPCPNAQYPTPKQTGCFFNRGVAYHFRIEDSIVLILFNYTVVSGLLVTLLWEFGNMRSDHVIYLPSSQNATYDRRKISKRSLRDTFILDRKCLETNKPEKR